MTEAVARKDNIVHAEVLEWFKSFCETVNTKDVMNIVHAFVQMGVVDPENCDCKMDWTREAGSVLEWIHKNHRLHNFIFWKALVHYPSLLPQVRAVLEKDLKIRVQNELEPAGEIVAHWYSRALLENFLFADRANVKWI